MIRLVLVLSALLAGCGTTPVTNSRPTLWTSIETPDGVAGVYRDAAGVHLVLNQQDTGPQFAREPLSVHLFSLSGETGLTYNSFVFGVAPVGASDVELNYDGVTAPIRRRVFLVALRQRDVLPQEIEWKFLGPGGLVIAQGTNISPTHDVGDRA